MTVSASTLRQHLDYSAWASARLLDAAASLTPEERERDFGTADKSILGTMAHTFGADRVWLARIHGTPQAFLSPEDREFDRLRTAWPAVYSGWRDWAAGLTDDSVLEVLSYHDLKGNPWSTPVWQIVLHVVNHATHHRGQAAGFIRSLGRVPPPLDLIAYYRSLGA
jgi:uncharacterized damage-inducible protein DinB